jgi:hypothetical protein
MPPCHYPGQPLGRFRPIRDESPNRIGRATDGARPRHDHGKGAEHDSPRGQDPEIPPAGLPSQEQQDESTQLEQQQREQLTRMQPLHAIAVHSGFHLRVAHARDATSATPALLRTLLRLHTAQCDGGQISSTTWNQRGQRGIADIQTPKGQEDRRGGRRGQEGASRWWELRGTLLQRDAVKSMVMLSL